MVDDELEARGISSLVSRHSVSESAARIKAALEAHGMTVFCVIDQSGEAAKVGLRLRPMQLIIFGDPKTGTPLMAATPSLAIDLPLKALIWEDAGGRVLVSHDSPEYLRRRHALAQPPFQGAAVILANAVGDGSG
jgi:uncharacterized protein (DUF302 family)